MEHWSNDALPIQYPGTPSLQFHTFGACRTGYLPSSLPVSGGSLIRRIRLEQAAFDAAKGANPMRCLAVGLDAAEKPELRRPGYPRGDSAQVLAFRGNKAFRHFPAALGTFGWRNHKMMFKAASRFVQ